MKTAEHPVDSLVRGELESAAMTEEEAIATWIRIEAELAATSTSSSPVNAKTTRKKFVVGLAFGVAAFAFVAVAVLPIGSGSENNGLNIASLESANAAEVFAVAAREASGESLFPGEDERLYFRSVEASPSTGAADLRIEEWIGPDGSGFRRDATRGGSSEGSSSGPTLVKPLTEKFDASTGPDPRYGVGESWRAVLSMDELVDLSTDPTETLVQLRRAASRAVNRAPDLDASVSAIVGSDLVVMLTVTNLVTQAPLSGEQREAIFKLIETAPDWIRSEGSAPIRATNLGKAVNQSGQAGILVETAIDLPPIGSAILGVNPGTWRLGILLDPEAGTVLEVRKSQAGDAAPYSLITTERLEIIKNGQA